MTSHVDLICGLTQAYDHILGIAAEGGINESRPKVTWLMRSTGSTRLLDHPHHPVQSNSPQRDRNEDMSDFVILSRLQLSLKHSFWL